jgi:AcrR family transcriptional regulator
MTQSAKQKEPRNRPARAKILERPKARPGRPPRGKTLLSEERLLKTAVVLLDEGGVEALSMRQLAERLGVTAMSLYRYCESHEGLLDAVACELVKEQATRPVTREQGYREVLTEMAKALRRAFKSHPRAALLLAERYVGARGFLVHDEPARVKLLEAGFDRSMAGYLIDSVLAFTVGLSLAEFTRKDPAVTLNASATSGAAREGTREGLVPGAAREGMREGLTPGAAREVAREGMREGMREGPTPGAAREGDRRRDYDAWFVLGLLAVIDGFGSRFAKRSK